MSLIQITLYQFSRVLARWTPEAHEDQRLKARFEALQAEADTIPPRARLFRP